MSCEPVDTACTQFVFQCVTNATREGRMLHGHVVSRRTRMLYCRSLIIGVAEGALGAREPLPRAEKKIGQNLQGKVVSAPPGTECTPPPRQSKSSIF